MPDNPRDPDIERKLERWSGPASRAEISPELRRRVRDRIAPSLRPVKPVPGHGVLVLRFLATFAVAAAVLLALIGRTGFHPMTVAQRAWMVSILAGGAFLYSAALARQMVPGHRPVLPFSLVLALSGLGLMTGIALNFPWMTSRRFVSEGWPCALMELAMALPVALLVSSLARRGAPFPSAELGAALAGLAVVTALTPLQFQCMFPQAPHLLAWHGGSAALLIGLGAWIGSTWRRGGMRQGPEAG